VLAISVVLTALQLRWLSGLSPGDSYNNVVLAWILAILLYLIAATSGFRFSPDWRARWRSGRRLGIPLLIIVSVALLVRAWRLGTIPFVLGGDEGSQGLEAIRVIEGKITNPFVTGWLGVPTMSFYFNSITVRLFGRTVEALRLPWALVGSTTVLIAFFLVRRLKGTPVALATAVMLATYHYHIHFSRLGSNQIADPFFMSLALLFLYRALDRKQSMDWALTGILSGLAMYFYAGGRLTPLIVTAVLGYVFIRDPRGFWPRHGSGILVALGGFLIVGGPMIQYAFRFPDDFNARLNQVGIFQSGWIDREVVVRGQSAGAILFDQFRRAALAFNFYPDRTVWYGLRQPLLSPFFGAVFLLGLVYASLRLVGRSADERLAPMVAWWWGGMIFGGMLTESPPSSQRLITLSVPVCFLIALALWEMMGLAGKGMVGFPGRALVGFLVSLFAVSSLVTYFLEYSPQRLYGGSNAELATEIAPVLREMSADHHFYFVGAPWMYWGFATLPYLVPGASAIDILDPVTELSLQALPQAGAVYIFIPPRIGELAMVRTLFPGGEQQEFYSPVDGRLMVTLYEVAS
jgi:4-amino-4-deoxy-L-arabinose transferase-like glycosyltransferase